MTIMRITVGINKEADAEKMDAQSGPPMCCGETS